MNKDDLKKYSVLIEVGGSGCLFQPMTKEYTYIITAKHLFFETKETEKGQEYLEEFPNGTIFKLQRFVQTSNGWDKIPILFTKSDATFFSHNEADLAILKIDYIEGFDKINIEETLLAAENYELSGYPSNVRNNREYTTHKVENFITNNGLFQSARLFHALRQDDIEGMSGCGLLRLNDGNISIIGIQSKMGNQIFPAGEIGFVPIKFLNEIAHYEENKGELSILFPPYMKKFDFLLDDCFSLKVDEIDNSKIENTRITLRNKAYEITQSDITPIGIKELFKERLLVNENETCCLSHKKVWIAWLEFLVILNIAKDDLINTEQLSDVFNAYRLKYANIEDWTSIFRTDLMNSDYIGLKKDSTVIVNTKGKPKTSRNLFIPKGKMIDIGIVPDRRGFTTDKGIVPHTAFNFVHLDYFKTTCIIEKLDEYENLNETEIIEKFKNEYHELFN